MRIAFDIGGVISKYPAILREMAAALVSGGSEVVVITDMQDHEAVVRVLAANGFGFISPQNVHCAEYATHGERCKAELLCTLNVDMILDDFIGYVAEPGCPIRCLVMPDASRPYYADEWERPDGATDFGRTVYRRPQC